ncbi:MAG: radical SAM family heme chaperone HemW [Candidatus Acidiferrales bacterium]
MSLGVYIQVPFCQTRCTYCNFHTGVVARERYKPYADAVSREIRETFEPKPPVPSGATVDSVYFGGGTPTLLEPSALKQILDALKSNATLARGEDGLEITLEADPETITRDKAHTWLEAKFNRISLGVQSFVDTELQAAGRMHRRGDIYSANEILRSTGLSNISMDLIAGLAHQSAASWSASIEELIAIAPEHISIYMLEIDEGSRLGKETLAGGSRYSAGALPTPDESSDFYELACTRLAQAGYEHYEISNWAKPGFRSRHNLKYWQRVPYLGFGAGAHSFDGQNRWANIHDSVEYVRRIEQGISVREQQEVVTPLQALEEEVFLGLRQLDGIDLPRLEREYDAVDLRRRIDALESQGLLEWRDSKLRLAPDRLAVSNEILSELLA